MPSNIIAMRTQTDISSLFVGRRALCLDLQPEIGLLILYASMPSRRHCYSLSIVFNIWSDRSIKMVMGRIMQLWCFVGRKIVNVILNWS